MTVLTMHIVAVTIMISTIKILLPQPEDKYYFSLRNNLYSITNYIILN